MLDILEQCPLIAFDREEVIRSLLLYEKPGRLLLRVQCVGGDDSAGDVHGAEQFR